MVEWTPIFILAVIFGGIIAIINTIGQARRPRTASFGDNENLARALNAMQQLEMRIESLERILDEDVPNWRARTRR